MKEVIVVCPNCGAKHIYTNWFVWVLYHPFHWFGRRLIKCDGCGKKSYMKRVK